MVSVFTAEMPLHKSFLLRYSPAMTSPNSDSSSRRRFLGTTTGTAMGGFFAFTSKSRAQAPQIIGHGDFKYEVVKGWGNLNPAQHPVANCHEMVEDSKGRLILFQTDTKNNVIIYDKSGKLLEAWGNEYPGAHGLDIVNENGENFLYLSDTGKGIVVKTDMKGKVLMTIGRPDVPEYQNKVPNPRAKAAAKGKGKGGNQPAMILPPWRPTNIMPAPDGTFYIGDGYGSSWVLHYSADGELLHMFGGRGDKPGNLNVPHGGIVDTRDPKNITLMICSRTENALKRFTLSGIHLQTIPVPGMRICQLANHGDYMIGPSLEGVINVVDKNNNVVSNPGGSAPTRDGKFELTKIEKAADSPFTHPHGIWIDADESVYVPQWNSGRTYPIKLKRV
ncbi:MAG: 6-bladed beta-propeller [Verrucomicrobiales bacterium]|nr:6-bladed beta-propeller [Verrucomicrobiales bacterium]